MPSLRRHTSNSGKVFTDLGFDDADVRLTKAKLAYRIASIIEERQFTQVQATDILGIDQPNVSAITRGRLSGFSTDRLLHLLTRLDLDVTITVSPKPTDHDAARIEVVHMTKPLAATG